ncbi:hypothetical protein RUM44_000669 [Polyplax serrata]|uniref:Uncharacterized protein n=1 Tax=Polyplax serrata TaxID=468196 RepID=A0ABR1B604_POLSC
MRKSGMTGNLPEQKVRPPPSSPKTHTHTHTDKHKACKVIKGDDGGGKKEKSNKNSARSNKTKDLAENGKGKKTLMMTAAMMSYEKIIEKRYQLRYA